MRSVLAAAFLSVLCLPGIVALSVAAEAAPAKGKQFAMLAGPAKADRVVVLKSERRLVLMRGDRVLRVYNVALGRYPEGHKTHQGDAKTPEGTYTIDYRLDSDRSKFYRALHISYPSERDVQRARQLGVDPGGQIMIHGLPKDWTANQLGHPKIDWTQGCIALTNREIDEVWQMVSDGTTVEIHP